MAYANYNEFRGAVLLMVDGDEVQSVIQPQTIDLMISLGEALVHYGTEVGPEGLPLGPLRASSMESALAETVTDNAASIPPDCLELSITWLDDGTPLDVVSETDLRKRLPYIGGGTTRKLAQAGDTVIFSPAASDGSILGGRYYAKPPALKDELHATFHRYPEIYMYAALYSSAPFLGFDRRIAVWQSYYTRLLAQANSQERQRVYSASRLRQVAR
jgi:hypothetical protein